MSFSFYKKAQAYINSLKPSTKKDYLSIGLDRMRVFLEILDNPERKFRSVHVGGTAGKGSTSSIIASILQEAGYKTGLHLSPHIEDVRERMQINNKLISEDKFVSLTNRIIPAVEKMKETKFGQPSYFEILTAMAFIYFAEEKADIAVIEVGLGGNLDATNLITPEAIVLTNVDLDHTEILGKTIEEIALDKIGIFKPNIPVVSGASQKSVIKLIENAVNKNNSSLALLNKDFSYTLLKSNLKGVYFNFKMGDYELNDLYLDSLGEYQAYNASLALAVIKVLNEREFNIQEHSIRVALSNLHIPARFEITNSLPLIILDGAHSPVKMQAFTSSLSNIFPDRKIIFIIAIKRGKDIENICKFINPLAKKVYITTFGLNTDFGKHHSSAPQEIAKQIKTEYEIIPNPFEAYLSAVKESTNQDIICITGSLYLAGELRKHIIAHGITNKCLIK